jgi:hypothetical protein
MKKVIPSSTLLTLNYNGANLNTKDSLAHNTISREKEVLGKGMWAAPLTG